MPVINICFLCRDHVSPHLNSANDIGKKIQKEYPRLGEKEHRRKQTTVSLNDCFPGRAASPFFTSAIHRFHVAYCVFYIFFYLSAPPHPAAFAQIDIRMRIYGVQFLTVLFILVISRW